MIFDFLLGRKKDKKNKTETKKDSSKLSLEEKINQEIEALPSFIKKQLEKDPSIKDKLVSIAKRMKNEGVDLNSPKAMKKWVKEHEKELKQEHQGKVETVVKEKEPGRNDLCPCGSGKKYKKCCGANK